jgi:hypothetical protein
MTKLSDPQAIILANASQRFDGNVLPLPGSLRGGAQAKVIGALLSRGLIADKVTENRQQPDAATNTVWRNDEDGRAVLLFITPAGLEAIGCEPETAEGSEAQEAAPESHSATERPGQAGSAATGHDQAQAGDAPDAPRDAAQAGETAPKVRAGTKQACLIGMLRAAEGATIAEIVAATGWQPHTVRGASAGALKKKLGLDVTSDKVEGRGRVYRIAG